MYLVLILRSSVSVLWSWLVSEPSRCRSSPGIWDQRQLPRGWMVKADIVDGRCEAPKPGVRAELVELRRKLRAGVPELLEQRTPDIELAGPRLPLTWDVGGTAGGGTDWSGLFLGPAAATTSGGHRSRVRLRVIGSGTLR